MRILLGWAINALCLLALPYLLSAVKVAGFGTALVVALVLGLLNVVIRPILVILTLPINIVTLGLFTFVINGLLFWLAARFVDGFSVASFGWAIISALLYSVITSLVGMLILRKE